MTALLQVEAVTVRFGGVRALDAATLQVEEGGLIGLIGPNGSGKSTLVNVVTRLVTPERGKVVYRGRDLLALRAHEIAGMGIARTFQHSQLFPSLSVLENVLLGLQHRLPYGLSAGIVASRRMRRAEEEAYERVRRVLQNLGVWELRHRHVAGLSHPEQRLVELARALVGEPQLIFFDEPMAGMHPSDKRELCKVFARMHKDSGITFVLIEHDYQVVEELCSRVVVLNFGRKIAEGTPQEIRACKEVIEAYLGAAER